MQDDARIFDEPALLIKKAKEGDAEAFGVLYTKYVTPIYRFVYLRVRSREDAEDLTQAVFMKAWNAMPRFEERGNPFSSLLYTIARNSVIDYWKKKKEVSLEDDAEMMQNIRDQDADPFADTLRREDTQNVLAALRRLSDDQQEIIALKFIQDLSNKEIAEITGKTEEAIRALQHRALKALREHFKTN